MFMGVNFPELGLSLMRGAAIADSFKAPEGPCSAFTVTPLRLLRAAVSSRPPPELGEEAAGFWHQIGADPVPELLRCFVRFEPPLMKTRAAAAMF
jgi:hypothetical protein